MSDFNRAYRDPKSPLQPLTPLSCNSNFSFNIGGDGSLKPWIDQIDLKRGKRQSNSFFSPQPQSQQQTQQYGTPNLRVNCSPATSGCQCGYPKASPLPTKKGGLFSFKKPQLFIQREYTPNFGNHEQKLLEVLKTVGMVMYWNFFKQNHIDFAAFQSLTHREFEALGIDKPKHLYKLLQGVEIARTM